jgi:hypothetical protein
MERRKERGEGGQTLVIVLWGGGSSGRALTKWRRNGARAQALKKLDLQKALRPKPGNWVRYWLPPENPASHRKANCCIAQMHHFHIHPPIRIGFVLILRGGTSSLSAQ